MRGVNLSAVMILAVAATPGWALAQAGNTAGLVNRPTRLSLMPVNSPSTMTWNLDEFQIS